MHISPGCHPPCLVIHRCKLMLWVIGSSSLQLERKKGFFCTFSCSPTFNLVASFVCTDSGSHSQISLTSNTNQTDTHTLAASGIWECYIQAYIHTHTLLWNDSKKRRWFCRLSRKAGRQACMQHVTFLAADTASPADAVPVRGQTLPSDTGHVAVKWPVAVWKKQSGVCQTRAWPMIQLLTLGDPSFVTWPLKSTYTRIYIFKLPDGHTTV